MAHFQDIRETKSTRIGTIYSMVCFVDFGKIESANTEAAENIVIEPEVMKHYGREDLGVALPEGGGYIGTLNVYHELHCIVS